MRRTSQSHDSRPGQRGGGKPKTFHIRLARLERRYLVVELEARTARQARPAGRCWTTT